MADYGVPLPPQPQGDLRTTLYRHVIDRAVNGLGAGDVQRGRHLRGPEPHAYLEGIRRAVREAFGEMPFGRQGGPLHTELVSRHETGQCRIENVLFDSYPGWRVNASVFLPHTAPPYRALVIPVGHSGKQFANYQIPARAYASLGYAAILFDPPGQASEKQPGNDHFRDGVRSFLLGLCPNRYFVLDALRCIDYLETRDDVDLSCGVGMTGVSGGGVTSLYAAVLDDRIACVGPSCCVNRMIEHPVGDSYSECPEKYWYGRVAAGVDSVDIALACYPRPMLYMAGRDDEVFTIESTRLLVDECAQAYELLGDRERFAFFEDTCGHAYSLDQVAKFDVWMRRWMAGEPKPEPVRLDPQDYPMLDYELLRCHPPAEANMYTISRELGRDLAARRLAESARQAALRPSEVARGAVRRLVGETNGVVDWEETPPFRVWMQDHREVLCRVEGLEFPVTLYRPHGETMPPVLVVVADDRGRAASIEAGGMSQQLSRMFDREAAGRLPAVAVADLPGWGDTQPAVVPYAATSWGSMDRFLSYLSYGLGDSVLALKTRCLVSLVRELRERLGRPPVVLVGRGLGAPVAALAAALVDGAEALVLVDGLASFGHLLEEERYTWPAEAFLSRALAETDLPELLAALAADGVGTTVINPRDGAGRVVPAEALPDPAVDGVSILSDVDAAEAMRLMQDVLTGLLERSGAPAAAHRGNHDEP